jgi:predicted nucleic acid-binding protein
VNVVDSSGWLEYFAGAANADFFADAIEDTERLVVPTIILYEVYRRVRQQRDVGDALRSLAVMQQGEVVGLTAPVALRAAELGLKHDLPLADSIILATARRFGATLWTQDEDFRGLEDVEYVAK